MRVIDPKFHIDGEQIIKTSSGETVLEDEPLVLIRGRDHLALPTLRHMRRLCELDGCNGLHLSSLDERIALFERFAAEQPEKMKQPGVTRGAPFVPSRETELASNLIAAAEQRGAALAVEQTRDLVGGLHIDAPNNLTPGRERDVQEARNLGWNLALAQVEKALPPDLAAEAKRQGSTAGDLLAKYRPAPRVVVEVMREAVEAFPAEPEPIRETIALELEAEAKLRDGPTARLILEMAGLVRGKK